MAAESFILETQQEQHRNPYVVLGVQPVFEHDVWDELTELGRKANAIKDYTSLKNMKWLDALPEDDRVAAWKAELEKMTESQDMAVQEDEEAAESHATRRARQALPLLIEHYQHFIAAKQEQERLDAEGRALLAGCQGHLAAVPSEYVAAVGCMPTQETVEKTVTDADGKTRVNRVVVIPSIADIRAWAVRLQDALASTSARQPKLKRSKKKKITEETPSPAGDIAAKLAAQAMVEQEREKILEYENIRLQAYQLAEFLLLNVDSELHSRFRELSMEFHPDRNPGSSRAAAMFKEVNFAYTQLLQASPDERTQFARDMVFGQKTAIWTPEMRRLTDGITKLLAGVFALQRSRAMDPETEQRCPSCVDGVVVMQQAGDYIPVPLVCGECRGSGIVDRALWELRQRLRSTTAAKPRKKST